MLPFPENSLSGKILYHKIVYFLDQYKETGPHKRKKTIFDVSPTNFLNIKRYTETHKKSDPDSGGHIYLAMFMDDVYYKGWKIYLSNDNLGTLDNNTMIVDSGLVVRINPNGLERAQAQAKRK